MMTHDKCRTFLAERAQMLAEQANQNGRTDRTARIFINALARKDGWDADGGPGSGNWGHAGRPGKKGGSGGGGGKHNRVGSKETGFGNKQREMQKRAKREYGETDLSDVVK